MRVGDVTGKPEAMPCRLESAPVHLNWRLNIPASLRADMGDAR
jgi:hypothetical protein